MAPPAFNDLGKQARDLFNKHYHLGQVKLDVTSKTPTGLEFTCSGLHNKETGKILGHLESKHNIKEYGLAFKEKWTTDSQILSEITITDRPVEGLKLGLLGAFTPQTAKRHATLTASMKGGYFNAGTDINVDQKGLMVNAAAVLGSKGFLLGAQCSLDPNQKKLIKSNLALAYATDDFVLHTNVSQRTDFTASVYQKVNESLQSGVTFGWSTASNETHLALGCMYKVDDSFSWKAKVNNNSQVSLALTHKLQHGIMVSLSALVDAKNLDAGGHKLGLGIEFNA